MNKLLLFALLGTASATLLTPSRVMDMIPFPKPPDEDPEDRKLQNICPDLVDLGEALFSQLYGVGHSCSCSSVSGYTLTCSSNGSTCCRDTCGTIRSVIRLTSTGNPIEEESCVTFTAGPASGSTRCSTVAYSGGSPSDCEATFNGQTCECALCGELPGFTDIEYYTVDCSAVSGGDLVSATCDDFDTIEELNLYCDAAPTYTITIVLTSVFLIASFMWI